MQFRAQLYVLVYGLPSPQRNESAGKLAKNPAALKKLLKDAQTDGQKCDVYRDQIRIRASLYGMEKPVNYGSGTDAAELKRLADGVEPVVKQKLPKMQPRPMPLAERTLVAVPDGASRSLASGHVARQLAA